VDQAGTVMSRGRSKPDEFVIAPREADALMTQNQWVVQTCKRLGVTGLSCCLGLWAPDTENRPSAAVVPVASKQKRL